MYPALAVLQAVQDKETANPACAGKEVEVLWVGGVGGMEADLVKRAGVTFESIPAAGVHGVGLRSLPVNLWQLFRGLLSARAILRSYQPQVLFFTGGFVAAPVAVAGWLPGLRRKPAQAVYVPDIEPGLALKFLARFASRIAITGEESQAFFDRKDKVTVTGYPTRSDLLPWKNGPARSELGLRDDLPVLLVFGGSKGARSINRALLAALPELLKQAQVVHISGSLDWAECQTAAGQLPSELRANYKPFTYLHEQMGAALAAADLVVSRAGASALGEFPLFGLPAILVPYPYAWRYQKVNADHLVKQGAAQMLQDADLKAQLLPSVLELLSDPGKLEKMRQAMRGLAQPQAARQIASMLCALAGERGV